MNPAPTVRVGDVASWIKGRKPSTLLDVRRAGTLPYLLIQSFLGDYRQFTDDSACVRCEPADTVVVADGANSGLATTGHDAYLGSTLGALRPDATRVAPRYLYYFVRGSFRTLNTRTRGAAVPHIEKDVLLNLPFPLPGLPEQERVVQLLDSAEALNRLRAAADAQTARIQGALFNSMFGDPVVNPHGWAVRPAGDLMVVCEYGTSTKASDDGSGIPMLRMGNVTAAGDLDLADVKAVHLDEGELDKHRLTVGDVLFNRTNSRDLVGKTGMWDGRFDAV